MDEMMAALAQRQAEEDKHLLRGCIVAALSGLAANPVVLSRLESKKRKKETIDVEEELVRQAVRLGTLTYSNIKGNEA